MATSVITLPQYFHDYSDQHLRTDIPNIVSTSLSAYLDAQGSPQSLTLGATSNLNVESAMDVNVYMGTSNAYTLYTSSFDNATRSDVEVLTMSTANGTTLIAAPSNIQIQSEVNGTIAVGSLQVTENATTQVLSTTKNSFMFTEPVQVQGDVIVSNNILASGSIYGQNMNLWLDRENKSYSRIGYALTINSNDNLEVVKYAKFSSNVSVIKKIAQFGTGEITSADSSDSSYLVFNALGNVSVASSNGTLSPVMGTSSSAGSNMELKGTTLLNGNITPASNLAFSIGSQSAFLKDICASNLIFPSSDIIVNGYPLLSDSQTSSSQSNAASSYALSNLTTLAVSASNTATWTSNNTLKLTGGTLTGSLTVNTDVNIGGNLIISGTTTTVDTQTVLLADNLIMINSTQTGTPLTTLLSGIEVNRGAASNYLFAFEESSSLFKVGKSNALQAVMTRDDNLSTGYPYYDASLNKATTRSITIGDITNLSSSLTYSSNIAVAASNNSFNKISSQWVANGSNIYFSTSNTSNICVGIGYSNPAYKLAVNGQIFASDDITAFSDRRVKTDLRVIPDALNKVCQLNGYTFARSDHPDPVKRFAGVVAQEIFDVLPEVVHVDPQGLMSVAYGNLAGLFIEAIKDLKNLVVDATSSKM
ncbi:Long tail fiber protein p37 [Tetrabaena socialis]|uniref:Long tail fiber protein p37 n=1 Tax=Tetrabaena socialis TaxID=47790 RepID=A0A2J8AJ66_9CHLO|nr:Long tail fiber protein p37 [Tetrabaena socialis]|eukprot:PNH12554.1 Long tail fiber protein p37 [Tetrabaena socialis]